MSSAGDLPYLPRLLSMLSNRELRLLRANIASPNKREVLLEFIDSWLLLHPATEEAVVLEPSIETTQVAPLSYHEDRRAFVMLLSDRDSVPNTKEVARLINYAFKSRIASGEILKRRREAIVEKAWKVFERLPRNEQMSVMNRIIERLPNAPRDNSEYQRLFRFLTKNER